MDNVNATAEVTTETPALTPTGRVKKVKAVKERKKGPPESRVFNAAILAAKVAEMGGDVEAARLKLFDVGVLTIGSAVDSVTEYVKGYKESAPQDRDGGYSSFVTVDDAYTNQKMIASFSVQGVARQMALLISRAADFMIAGGPEATEMAAALVGLNAYQSVAVDEARKTNELTAMDAAIATIAKARGCTLDEARASFVAYASQSPSQSAPASTVKATEPTLASSGGNIADSDDDLVGDEVDELEEANA
jgi:hypothetical protein